MTQKKPTILTIFLLLVLLFMGGAAVLKGGLYIAKHEGDTLHLMEIVFRMAQGQTPHIDFMTPIGALAVWPIVVLVKLGAGIGMAVIWSQVIAAVVFLPMIIWTAWSRLSPWIGALFGLFVMVLLLALVHGEAERSISISMHYNRLAWAAAFIAIVTAMIPPERGHKAGVDGLIIGVMMTMMVMIKVTYFISFAPPVVVALLLAKQTRALLVSVATGLFIAAVITAFNGIEYWFAYVGDLLAVAGSEVRSAPGETFSVVLGGPAYLGGSMAAIAGVIFLRQAGVQTGGLVLMLLVPGFFYVTYQNFGNDPQWLLLVGVLLLALKGQAAEVVNGWGWNMRDALGILAAVCLALTAHSFFNLAYSPFRHLNVEVVDYAPLLPRGGVHADLLSEDIRVNRVDAQVELDGEISLLSAYEDRDPDPVLMGETFPVCNVGVGMPRVIDVIARDIEDAGLASGKSLFATDVITSYWMFNDLEPLDQGTPWYYGGAPGLENADYVMVPLCPVVQRVQSLVLNTLDELIEAGELELTEIRRTELYVLYEKSDLD